MIIGSVEPVDAKPGKEKVARLEKAEELSGKLSKQKEEDKLMSSVLENDRETIEEGKLLSESINQNLSSFVPDMMFKNLVSDYKLAKKLYGEFILRKLTGYDPSFVEKNLKIPEFREELKKNLEENVRKLKEKDLLGKEGELTNSGLKLSSLVMYCEELDRLKIRGLGDKKQKRKDIYGDKADYESYKKTRYRDIAIKQSVKTALRRGHSLIEKQDLRVYTREKKGGISIIYALDTSGSMKGERIRMAKQAGIALAYKAISERNKVGLIVFSDEVKAQVYPTLDFPEILSALTNIRTRSETDFAATIEKSIDMFGPASQTKHLVLLTDALATKGKDPEKQTLKFVSIARDQGITISVVGLNLDEEGRKLASKIVEISQGRLYIARNLDRLDSIVLEDYYSLS